MESNLQNKIPGHSEFKEVLISFCIIALSIAITANLIPAIAKEYVYSVILAAMVYLPVIRGEKYGRSLAEYGIHLKTLKSDLKLVSIWIMIIFPAFIVGFHFWQKLVMGQHYDFSLPEKNILYLMIEHIIFIALPEEFFYRGWMQSVLSRRWPAKLKILGGDFGLVVVIVSVLFALGHLAAIPSAFRLAVFFPSLMFCWLRAKSGSLVAPIIFHGLSNVLMAVLSASYHY